MAKRRSINGRETVGFKWEGKRRVEYIGQPSHKEGIRIAKRVATEVGVLISSGQFSWDHYRRIFPNSKRLPAVVESTVWTLGDFCRQWLREQVSLTPRARENYRSQLNHVLCDPIGKLPLRSIHDGDLKEFQGRLKDKTATHRDHVLSATVINQVFTRLRSIFATAHRRHFIDDNPADPKLVKKLKQPRSLVDPLDGPEVVSVLGQSGGCANRLFTGLINTGCRPSEVLNLRLDELDTDNWLSFEVVEGKTEGSARTIHLNAEAAKAIREQAASTSGAFLVFDGEDLRTARTAWYKTLDAAGVRRRTLYQTRHTFATLALEGGANLRDLADALGHVDLVQVTKTYLRWIRGSRKNAAVKAVEGLLLRPEAAVTIDRVLSHLVRENGSEPMITDENQNGVEA